MLQTVLLCLRLDSPALSGALTLPPLPLGDAAPSSPPSAKAWLSQSLKSLLEEQENTALQEMQLVENVYLIGEVKFSTDAALPLRKMKSKAGFALRARRSWVDGSLSIVVFFQTCRGVHGAEHSAGWFLCLCARVGKVKGAQSWSQLRRHGTNGSGAEIWGK